MGLGYTNGSFMFPPIPPLAIMGAFVPAFFLHLPIIRFIIPHFLGPLAAAAPAAPAAAAAPAAPAAAAFFFLNIQLNIPGFLGPLAAAALAAAALADFVAILFANEDCLPFIAFLPGAAGPPARKEGFFLKPLLN